MAEGKNKIFRELGEEAIILSSREIIDPDTGSKKVEIVAAVDNQIQPVRKPIKSKISPKSAINFEENKETNNNSNDILEYLQILEQKIDLIQSEVKYKFTSSMSDSHAKLFSALIDSGISDKYALEILANVSEIGFTGSSKDMFFKARQILTQNIMISEPMQTSSQQRVFYFIGPAGSGKTVSLVKLAAVIKLVLKSNILIVSADTTKVGGADQLQSYASILGIPFKAVDNSANLATLLENEHFRDIIFIDTPGKNPFEERNIEELCFWQDIVDDKKTFLVMSANTSLDTMDAAFDSYKKTKPTDLILTKIDESKSLGAVLSVLKKHKLPIAYLTTGQNVPEDIEPAEREMLSKYILPDKLLKELMND